MTAPNNDNFRWNSLLSRIKLKKVIPVIGQGLYRVEIQSGDKKDCLLYDYLSERILEACGESLNPQENHKFAKACFEFLKKNHNDYFVLADFLKDKLKGTQLVQDNSLRKLAMINNFNMFINATYDSFMTEVIKNIRNIPPKVLYYSLHEKNLHLFNNDLFDSLENSKCTLVYHILGNIEKCWKPSYTEGDILETIVEFHRDIGKNPQNQLFKKLEKSSLLFCGCGYDDWLFRFFIRTVANESYKFHQQNQTCNFVEGNFLYNNRDPFHELPRFLSYYDTEIFYSSDGSDFVNLLFKKIEENYPDGIISTPEIISSSDSPVIAFISFEGKDRPLARKLAKNLRKDGINVWLDERKFEAGDDVDKKILNAIDRCPAFIPLISKNSEQTQTADGKLKYHIKEWYRAYSNKKTGDKNVIILPVKIDDTKWIFDEFKDIFYIKIPNCGKVGDYKKLRDQLEEIKRKIRINNENEK